MSSKESEQHKEGFLPDMTIKDWLKSWDDNDIGFHRDHVNPLLIKYYNQILGNKSLMKAFFPMCGKSVDMKWLADKGHCVYGVEVAERAIKEFFDEQNLDYTVTDEPKVKGKLYKSSCGKIKIYCCDFYDVTSEVLGQFDFIWDRGSFNCTADSDRKRYSEVIKSLLDPTGVYYIVSYFYEKDGVEKYGSMNGTEISELYGDICDIETLELNPSDWAPLMGFDIRLQSVNKRNTKEKEQILSNTFEHSHWVEIWDTTSDPGFHLFEINPMLLKYASSLLDSKSETESTVFVPLCGKTKDLRWFYDKGFHVVGVELAEKAVKYFFTDQNLEYTVEEVPELNASCYKTTDKRLRIYVCDVYKFMKKRIEFDFDIMYDRAAFVAINEEDQRRYSELMVSIMAEGCRCLMITYIYDHTRFGGPPHNIPNGRIEELYGQDCEIKHLGIEEVTEQRHRENWNILKLEYRMSLITK